MLEGASDRLTSMPESLKEKTVRGTIWSGIDSIAGQGISFLVGLVLARLLSPQEYGLIGYILIIVAILNSIVDSGFSNALIRKKDAGEVDYSTTFIFNMVLSLLLAVVMAVTAGPVSRFLDEPELVPLIRAMSVIVVINAAAIVQRTTLTRRVDFKTQTKVSLISSGASGVVGIGMALCGMGVWSLVGQQISRQLLNTVFLWVFNRWMPAMQFSWKSFRELFGFGWKLMVSGLLNTIWNEMSQVIIGKCYSTATLGQFTRGKQFSDIFSSNMTTIIQRVSYPVLSSVQDERTRLREGYRRIIKVSMLLSFVLMFGLGAVAEPLLYVLLGGQWTEAAGYLRIIVFSACLYPLHAINLNMLQVQGRSDLFLKLEIIKKVIAIGPILLGIFLSIEWMLWGWAVTGIIGFYLNSRYSGVMIGYSSGAQIKDILPSFGVALAMMAALYALSLTGMPPLALLAIQLLAGAGITIGLCELLGLGEYRELKNIVLGLFRGRKA